MPQRTLGHAQKKASPPRGYFYPLPQSRTLVSCRFFVHSGMLRAAIFKTLQPDPAHGFRNRGEEIKRIETFSDAVFAFAVTLLIVSLEVPKTFQELLISMRGFVAFGICFTLLMLVWHEQNIFFRRYTLDDKVSIFLNAFLMFIVLFYVYP